MEKNPLTIPKRPIGILALTIATTSILLIGGSIFDRDAESALHYLFLTSGVLIGAAAIVMIRSRSSKLVAARRTRDTVLKHVWEETHRREW